MRTCERSRGRSRLTLCQAVLCIAVRVMAALPFLEPFPPLQARPVHEATSPDPDQAALINPDLAHTFHPGTQQCRMIARYARLDPEDAFAVFNLGKRHDTQY